MVGTVQAGRKDRIAYAAQSKALGATVFRLPGSNLLSAFAGYFGYSVGALR